MQTNSLLTFSVDIDDGTIASCADRNEAVGKPLKNFIREYMTPSAFEDEEAVFPYDEIERFILNGAGARVLSLNDVSPKTDYVLTISPDTVNADIVVCSVFGGVSGRADNNKDFLTGQFSREYTVNLIESRLTKTDSGTLILVDLDNFKQVNETFGHDKGDECIKKIGAEVQNVCKGHLVGRYGGDEFVVWLEEQSEEKIKEIVSKLLSIRYIATDVHVHKTVIATCSCGAANAPDDGKSFYKLFRVADKELYRAKHSHINSASVSGNDEIIRYEGSVVAKSIEGKIKNERLFNAELKFIRLRSAIISLILAVVLAVCGVIVGRAYSGYALTITRREAEYTMADFSTELSTYLSDSLKNYVTQLNLASDAINATISEAAGSGSLAAGDSQAIEIESYSTLGQVLKEVSSTCVDMRVGMLTESGELYFSSEADGDPYDKYNVAGSDFSDRLILGGEDACVDNMYFNNLGERIVFAVKYDYEATASLFSDPICGMVGAVNTETITNVIHASIFGEASCVQIVRSDGTRVAVSAVKMETFEKNNVLNALQPYVSSDEFETAVEALASGKSGSLQLTASGEDYIAYYTALTPYGAADEQSEVAGMDVTGLSDDWRIVVIVPEDALSSGLATMYRLLLWLTIAFLLTLWVVFMTMNLRSSRLQLKNHKLRYTDPLTGGLNRDRFVIDGERLIRGGSYAVVLVNATHFKYVNEQVGHTAADGVLCYIYNKAEAFLEKDELLARGYADSFMLLLKADERLKGRVNELHRMLSSARYADGVVTMHFTMGVYVMPVQDVFSAGNRIAVATDRALFAQRQADTDNNSIVWFSDKMLVNEIEEANIEQRSLRALKEGQFIVYYQMKRNIQKDVWHGSEALVRWNDPNEGMISPGKFVPLFERNGFIVEVDKCVFTQVCRDLRACIKKGKKALPVSVNLSRRHFSKEDFIEEYIRIMDSYFIPHNLIEFELTEGIVMENEAALKKFIKRIHEIGCTCSIDDFGSGYSSLNMLKEFDFDVVKFDRRFFYGEGAKGEDSRIIIASLISLCRQLGMTIIAEGIEEQEQSDFLKSLGCDAIQGYLYAKPQPREACLPLLEDADADGRDDNGQNNNG